MSCVIDKVFLIFLKFQFQNGTIMRVAATGFVTAATRFQFQNGTIMRFKGLCYENWVFCISIPKWYDYEHLIMQMKQCRLQISIPKWYDYERR